MYNVLSVSRLCRMSSKRDRCVLCCEREEKELAASFISATKQQRSNQYHQCQVFFLPFLNYSQREVYRLNHVCLCAYLTMKVSSLRSEFFQGQLTLFVSHVLE